MRERLIAAPTAPPPRMTGSMGFMLDHVLVDTRQRIIDLGTQLRVLPPALRDCWYRVSATMPASDTLDLFIYLVAFVAGGIAAQRLFLFAARPWLAHFDRLDMTTLDHRLAVLVERLAFAILLLGTFAAGSMGTFLLFSWPAQSGSMILGYLWATLGIRLSYTLSRFFLAPGAERLRLVPLTTDRAWVLAPLDGGADRDRRVGLADDRNFTRAGPAAGKSGTAASDPAASRSRCAASRSSGRPMTVRSSTARGRRRSGCWCRSPCCWSGCCS